jgi:hypothetical protein
MFFDSAGNVVVGNRRESGHCLVPRIHDDGHHLARPVLVSHLVDRDRRSLTAKVFCHLRRAVAFGFLSEFIG